MASSSERFLSYWLEAANTPLGIYILTPNPHRLKARLYSARAAADPWIKNRLQGFQIRTSPKDPVREIWVVKPPEASPGC